MIKPSDRVLIGWMALLAAFASANLEQVSANELNATNPDPSAGVDALAAEQLSAAQGADDRAAVAAQGQSVELENDIQPPGVNPQSSPEAVEAGEPLPDDNSAATSDRADKSSAPSQATSTSPHISSGEMAVMRSHPSAAPEIGNIPTEALPTARVILPGSAVVEPVLTDMVPNAPAVETISLDTEPEVSMPEIVVENTAQLPLEPTLRNLDAPSQEEIDDLLRELEQPGATASRPYQSSPAITISNPSGFGVDNFTAFVGLGYQERTRFGNVDDGGAVVGFGFGDARENVGVQLSYTAASFGGSREFGTGGFNAKIHRRVADDWSVALGWEGFATTGFVDFEDSIYGSVSHIVRTRENIAEPFSRVALTAGVGNGRFRTEDAIFDDRDDLGVFGSVAVRVVEPVSAIVEWTGQDLAAGLSITPFRDLPLVLLPAVRDIAGAGDGPRFVLGAGISFQL
ncbi:hypothetical protein [Leptothoe sp. PORK10 BA2]|uniref:hypothetical protein n=1 Tax=Leptothoe sp. PORK10 BA2 TaxID=3110254 RepID=UPI002B21A3AB|nr:hypothetical protein [Leptothoe sp. PORK10 BA2]MEA5462481.1 hypothetical protein [Leptothoe sp. PORK10 BA2]